MPKKVLVKKKSQEVPQRSTRNRKNAKNIGEEELEEEEEDEFKMEIEEIPKKPNKRKPNSKTRGRNLHESESEEEKIAENDGDMEVEKTTTRGASQVLLSKSVKLKIDEKQLFKKFFKNEDTDLVEKLLIFHENYFENIKKKKEKSVNKWEILRLEFSNLFIFGEKNVIDFSKFPKNEVIGLFAPNSYGKSSVIDIIIFALYGKISRFSGKGYCPDLINIHKSSYSCSIEFKVEQSIYKICRSGETKKNGKLDHTLELYLNNAYQQDKKTALEETISTLVGSYDEFILTSILLQKGGKSFKDLPQRERKDLLNSVLQLDKYERVQTSLKDDIKKFKAKSEVIEGYMKGKNARQIKQELENIDKLVEELNEKKAEKQKKVDKLEGQIRQKCADYKIYTKDIPKDIDRVEIETLQTILNSSEEHIEQLKKDIEGLQTLKHEKEIIEEYYKVESENKIEINNLENRIKMIENKFSKSVLDVIKKSSPEELRAKKKKSKSDFKQKEEVVLGLKNKIDENNKQIEAYKNIDQDYYTFLKAHDELKVLRERQAKYSNVEYNPACSFCMKNPLNLELIDIQNKIQQSNLVLENLNNKYPDGVILIYQKHKECVSSMPKLNESLKKEEGLLLKLKQSYEENKITWQNKKEYNDYEEEIKETKQKIDDIQKKAEQRESVKRYRQLQKEKETLAKKNKEIETTTKEMATNKNTLYYHEVHQLMLKKTKSKKKLDKMLEDVNSNKAQKVRLEEMQKNFEKYQKEITEIKEDLLLHEKYLAAVHKNGVPLMIMAEYLPLLEQRINSLIEDFVDFSVIIENNEDNIDMYAEKSDSKKIYSIYGGMESFILDLAFKIALAEIARLPKCNIIFIDEGLSVLDQEKIKNLNVLFDFLKLHFDNALIITHIESIKQFIKIQMTIEKDNKLGISRIYESESGTE